MPTIEKLAIDTRRFSFLVHGKPGHGKTRLIGTAAAAGKKVVIVDVHGGPNSIVEGLPTALPNITVVRGVTSLRTLQEILPRLEKGAAAGAFDIIALDCATPLQKHILREARAEVAGGNPSEMLTSKTLSIAVNDTAKQRMEDVANALLNLPCGIIFTFWSSENESGKLEPNTRGDVWEYYAGLCEFVLHVEAKAEAGEIGSAGGGVKYSMYSKPIGQFEARDRYNVLPAVMPPDFGAVFKILEEKYGKR